MYVIVGIVLLFIVACLVSMTIHKLKTGRWMLTDEEVASQSGGSSGSSNGHHRVSCPMCGSKWVTRFSGSWKATKIATFGVFGLGNVHKSFYCRRCRYKW